MTEKKTQKPSNKCSQLDAKIKMTSRKQDFERKNEV